MTDAFDVAIVGGGPAGAATAIGLARRGYRVGLFERHATATWRACGVFATALVRDRLIALGIEPLELAALHRPISAMELRSVSGASCLLDYSMRYACGFDRIALDTSLLELAAKAGAQVERGVVVRNVQLADGVATIHASTLDESTGTRQIKARLVVGADGGSRVARAAGVLSERNWLGRSGITFHVADPAARAPTEPMKARFVLGRGWYVGLAPVPGERVNIGIVVPTSRLPEGVEPVIASVMGAVAQHFDGWKSGTRSDEPQVAGRLEHHVTRAAGDGWLLVGDAVGFIDPLTGEGLHRALVTADLATTAIHRRLSGDRDALAVYDRRVRSRFRSKNVFTLFLQGFIANPHVLDYALRRLASRPALRDELTNVLTDRVAASNGLDPRFMARLLAP